MNYCINRCNYYRYRNFMATIGRPSPAKCYFLLGILKTKSETGFTVFYSFRSVVATVFVATGMEDFGVVKALYKSTVSWPSTTWRERAGRVTDICGWGLIFTTAYAFAVLPEWFFLPSNREDLIYNRNIYTIQCLLKIDASFINSPHE